MSRINPEWMKQKGEEIRKYPHEIDVIITYNQAVQWLIAELARVEIPYKLYQLGAGVKRITTKDIDTCPCCKKKLNGGE